LSVSTRSTRIPQRRKEGDGTTQEAGGGRAFLVSEDFDVGEPGRVVDGDVDVLPADPARPGRPIVVDAVARPADPAQLLDVDVDELARPRPLIAVGRLLRLQPRQLPEPVSRQHSTDGRERHPERLRDLRTREAQLAQRQDQLLPLGRRP
jgi:hypothetical protein